MSILAFISTTIIIVFTAIIALSALLTYLHSRPNLKCTLYITLDVDNPFFYTVYLQFRNVGQQPEFLDIIKVEVVKEKEKNI